MYAFHFFYESLLRRGAREGVKSTLLENGKPDWLGFYGSPDSHDHDWAMVYFGPINLYIRESWKELVQDPILRELGIDLIAVSVHDGNVKEVLTANSRWPHPKEDVQNVLQQTVPELRDSLLYIPPDKRNLEAKTYQCKRWYEEGLRIKEGPTPVFALWAKRAAFIGGQLMALQMGEDAGYTKQSVANWLKENFKPVRSGILIPDPHVRDPRSRREGENNLLFLKQLLQGPEYVFASHVTMASEMYSGLTSPEIEEGFFPEPTVFLPQKYSKEEGVRLPICFHCGKQIAIEDLYPALGEWSFYGTDVAHKDCAAEIMKTLGSPPREDCQLEFREGKPYYVIGYYPSTSRIEYSVWDGEGNLIDQTKGFGEEDCD